MNSLLAAQFGNHPLLTDSPAGYPHSIKITSPLNFHSIKWFIVKHILFT